MCLLLDEKNKTHWFRFDQSKEFECVTNKHFVRVRKIIAWIKIITWLGIHDGLLRLGDLRCHGCNNNHMVEVMEQSCSWLKETNVHL